MTSQDSYPRYKSGIIIISENPQDYTCIICCINRKKIRDLPWEHHLKIKDHRSTLKFYEKSFIDLELDSTIKCKICHQTIKRSHFHLHAIKHELIPWYNFPPKTKKELFLNFISDDRAYENGLNCHICFVKFQYSSEALIHTTEQEHLDLLKEKFPNYKKNYSISMQDVDYYCQNLMFLVFQDVVYCWLCEIGLSPESHSVHCLNSRHMKQILPVDDQNLILFHKEMGKIWFYCEICECELAGVGPVYRHLDSERHKKNKRSSREKEGKADAGEKDKEDLPGCIGKYEKNQYMCRMCNVSWAGSADFVVGHVRGFKHREKINELDEQIKKFNESSKLETKSFYICSICNLRFNEINDADQHLTGPVHKNELIELRKQLDLNRTDSSDLPPGIVWRKNNQELACLLCSCEMNDIERMILHIETHQHMTNLAGIYPSKYKKKVYLSFGISLTNLNHVYYCQICRKTIRGIRKLGNHIEHQNHKTAMEQHLILSKKSFSNETKEIDVNSVEKYAKNCNEFPNEIKNIITEQNQNYWFCSICNCNLYEPTSGEFFGEIEKKIWLHINGLKHQRRLWMSKSNGKSVKNSGDEETVLPIGDKVEEVVEDGDKDSGVAEEDEIPVEKLYHIQMKDGDIAAATCLVCQLHFYGGTLDTIQDWNAHIMAGTHQQKEAIFVNKNKEKNCLTHNV